MNNIISQEEKDTIDFICKQYNIKNYNINPDGSIDVDGDVHLRGKSLASIPLRFNVVRGNFDCNNNQLTTLEFSPVSVSGNFNAHHNKITSLVGSPMEVGGYFSGGYNKELNSLYGYPKEVGGSFNFRINNLPLVINRLTHEELAIFLKYQSYYDVWIPELNEVGMNDLIADIKDGLR